jgi:hypothetical protein
MSVTVKQGSNDPESCPRALSRIKTSESGLEAGERRMATTSGDGSFYYFVIELKIS